MKKVLVIILLHIFFCLDLKAQKGDFSDLLSKNGIVRPSIVATHPFGIFISRLNHNFKTHASRSSEMTLSLESANVWGPYVKTYIPDDKEIRDYIGGYYWDQRQYFIDTDTINAQTLEIKTDGVIKGLRANVNFRINKTQEIVVGLRTFLLTKGILPLSFFTGDNLIENFHAKILGGNDPFDRMVFGLDKAEILYTDRNGRQLKLKNGDFIVAGIEAAYYYYPEYLINKKQNLHINFGGHLGTNFSKYNSALDLGLTSSLIKQFTIANTNDFSIGLGLGVLRKNIVDLKSDNIDFGTNDFLGSIENAVEYQFTSNGLTTHAFSVALYYQTSLNNKKEFEYAIPIRPTDGHKAWGHGTTNMFKNNNYWTIMYTFTRRIATSFYVQQDFTVNNNPDIQTGVSLRFRL